MLTTTSPQRPVHFDDLLDLDSTAANDVDSRGPALRVVPRWSLEATLSLDSADWLWAGLTYDMATGGVFVATVDMPPIGARVDLKLTFADGNEIETTGVVRWVRDVELASEGLPAGCGVECKGLPFAVVRTFSELADKREPTLWLPEVA